MKKKSTILDAFKAVDRFIQNYYNRSGEPNDIATLLGAMDLSTTPNPSAFTYELQGFEPLDRAVWEDWLSSVTSVVGDLKNENPRMLSTLEAYTAMYKLVNAWYEQGGKSEEPFKILLHKMTLQRNGQPLAIDEWFSDGGEPLDPSMWAEWLDAINSVISDNPK